MSKVKSNIKSPDKTDTQNVVVQTLDQALGERYLSYALSTITSRSLPDVRDGLKPVQRRILFAMRESGNTPDKPFRKSASSVGYVMMRYHPHGDSAIYDALVRMAQDFSMRSPLIMGQGNFGSIDGDNAAAMRYTEAKLSPAALLLLNGTDEDAVEFTDNYNGENQEPQVLPALFPNLLANGSTGIAVGMATNIPPHNVAEICDALLLMMNDKQTVSIADLVQVLPGPDFPTGGVIVDAPETLRHIYETGRGTIRLRAGYEIEHQKGGLYNIIVTSIPYQVQKSKLIENIADLWSNKKLPLLADIADESTTDIRIVLTPRSRTVNAELLMESLYKVTDLESRFSVNMNVLDGGRCPRVMNLQEILQAYLDHQQQVLCRKTNHRLTKIAGRLELLQGFIIVYLNLDEVIRIIRFEDDPKASLCATFKLTEIQVDAVLNMKLRTLRKLEEIEIQQEKSVLETEQEQLKKLLSDDRVQWKTITQLIKDLRKKFDPQHDGCARRTSFGQVADIDLNDTEAFIEREPVTVICSKNMWLRIHKGHHVNPAEIKYKEGDQEQFIFNAETTDKLLIFTTAGRFYTVPVDKLPSGRGLGEPLSLMVTLVGQETIVNIFVYNQQLSHYKFLLASTDGRGFVVHARDVIASTKTGKQILNVTAKGSAVQCIIANGDHIAIVGTNRKLIVIPILEFPEMRRGRGVVLQKYRDAELSDIISFNLSDGLTWQTGGRIRTDNNISTWVAKRGQSGRMVPNGFPKNNRFK